MKPRIINEIPKELDDLIKALDSKLFKALTDPTRAHIFKFLMLEGRADISTIANYFPQDRSVISRHLHLMSEAGLLVVEKETRHRFYSINGEKILREFECIVTNLKACIHECCPPKE
jgi:DNA-binding transcriptional ArsR family regulator